MNGHNPKANRQSDDFQDVLALLKELPRVSAPADFNASLKARIAAAKIEANEFADITALVKELPRVSAPSDFDFKLRARIAQAKAQQHKSSTGWFAELFGQTFSWLQAGTAMAAVAIVVSIVTFGVLRSDPSIDTPTPTNVAQVAAPTPQIASTAQTPMSVEPKASSSQSQLNTVISTAPLKTRSIKSASHSSTPVTVPNTPAAGAEIATSKVMIKHQSGEARMVNLSEYNLGLQTAHLRSAQTKTASVETAMANIY